MSSHYFGNHTSQFRRFLAYKIILAKFSVKFKCCFVIAYSFQDL